MRNKGEKASDYRRSAFALPWQGPRSRPAARHAAGFPQGGQRWPRRWRRSRAGQGQCPGGGGST
ncbi:hypothetical protein ATSB10_21970 [Dyella thiooxydans]|uniref:Uncharacterized protein n=1 Tax=Dyella thiooxydans TaxID=445710 RepID=A0A160N1D7_9GAMM|nr:hypothetical protein ATSB10_21970 [Dyella thiooxydans]